MLCSSVVLPSAISAMSMFEQRAALGDHRDILAKRGGDDLLALVAARLVVVLDRVRALRLQAPDVGERVVRLSITA
jgi:hypothetical protein